MNNVNTLSDIRCSTGDHQQIFDVKLLSLGWDNYKYYIGGELKCSNCDYVTKPCDHAFGVKEVSLSSDHKKISVEIRDLCLKCDVDFRDILKYAPNGVIARLFKNIIKEGKI